MAARRSSMGACGALVGMVMVWAVAVTWPGSGDHQQLIATRRGVDAAVVRLDLDTCGEHRWGTGVLLSSGEVLTAAHVVNDANSVSITFASGDEIDGDLRAARVDASADVATVAGAGIGGAGVLFGSRAPVRGDIVTISSWRTSGPFTRSGVVGDTMVGGPDEPPLLIDVAVAAQPGDSGSPVFDQQGRVVGVVVESRHGTGHALIVPVTAVRSARWSSATSCEAAGRG